MANNTNIPSTKELEFILFCIDFVAKAVNQQPESIYQKLKQIALLQDYQLNKICLVSIHDLMNEENFSPTKE